MRDRHLDEAPAPDRRADDHEKKEQDPGFTGFHRIEYGLFSQQSTAGLAPIADKLAAALGVAVIIDNHLSL